MPRGDGALSLWTKNCPNLDAYLPPGRCPCEIRLLAVEKEFRNGQVFRGLTALMWRFGTEHGYDMAIISGTTRQQKLYRHLGFVPFGPLVGSGDAMFQPMYLTLEIFEKRAEEFLREPLNTNRVVSFLPGPVAVNAQVRKAFERPPESHRSDRFVWEFQQIRNRLCQLVSARNVEILLGSGTLANDTVAAQLSLLGEPGLILSNGEFGQRLINHARRLGLVFEPLELPWGEPFDLAAVQQAITRNPAAGWLWCAHCETSTGMLNPLPALQALCAKSKIKLCADCISSIGLIPVSLEGVYLASSASGKGLAGYPGLSFVFYNHAVPSSQKLPRYLDLGWYAEHQGIAFTHSSNLVHALDTAIRQMDWPRKFSELIEISSWLRGRLRQSGFRLITSDEQAIPGVVTIALAPGQDSARICQQLEQAGFLLSYNSDYLRQRNWIQICLMGEYSRERVEALLRELERLARARSTDAVEHDYAGASREAGESHTITRA